MFDRIREDIACVFDRDPAARSVFEVILVYPGFHAVLIHRISHFFWRNSFKWSARLVAHIGRLMTGIEIHPGAEIGRRFFIDHGMGVVIGETAIIGDDCTIYHGVTLGGTTWNKGKRHPTLRNGVVVGAGAKILGPIEIGTGARVGSNSVVLKAVPAGATVVGIPGHIVNPGTKKFDMPLDIVAAKTEFDPYGTKMNMPDPVAHAINNMLAQIHSMDQQIVTMQKKLDDSLLIRSSAPLLKKRRFQ